MAQYPPIVIIIPAHNEQDCIGAVIASLKGHNYFADILVINDGSVDATSEVARRAGAFVIDLPYNLGVGGAVQTGYLFAVEMGYAIVARMDGDGQHDPAQLAGLIQLVTSGEADVAIGSRYVSGPGYQASRYRVLGIKLFATLVSLITGQRFTDTTSGFQASNREATAFLAKHLPADYPEIEGLVLLCKAGFRVREVPVTMRPRQAGESSITPWRAVYYVFKVLLGILIGLLRRPPERTEVKHGTD
ncbi:MAG: glycosyltransferase family 2 protein [Deltaproteobacteria bacterium]|nr:glycosyltransferase family 2 protein [Deltaproteobacteria bacterium]